jgi:thioredoxin reductase (NADPH)
METNEQIPAAQIVMDPNADDITAKNPADPYNRLTETFPTLSSEQMERVCEYGEIETMKAGQMLYERGQRDIDFFVVVEGAAEALEVLDDGGEHRLALIHPNQFSGELTLFNNRGSLAALRVCEDGKILRVPRKKFRRLMIGESELGEVVTRAFILRRTAFINHEQAAATIIGHSRTNSVLRMQQFLRRNGMPVKTVYLEADPERATALLKSCSIDSNLLPAVIYAKNKTLLNPSNVELGEALGFTEDFSSDEIFDVAIVGAGPAGLSAAVYAASEGLSTLVLDAFAPGGQAGASSKIENYMGFPAGISGQALGARAQIQSQKFGAKISVPHRVVHLDCDSKPIQMHFDNDQVVRSKAVIVATGAHYRKLNIPNMEKFEGIGIHYAATAVEASLCTNEEIVVVGAGNSAGQAAMYLSERTTRVHLLVRGPSLRKTMSEYLVGRIEASKRITVHLQTEITRLDGERYLEAVTWKDAEGRESAHAIANVFLMLGAVPNTDWVKECLELDEKGFVISGKNSSPFETSRPGVFAVGDVRAGSIKRVASAVGEGSVVISAVHAYLADWAAVRKD